MASIEQKKAKMAAVPIHHDAREILRIPDSVKTYAQFEQWAAKDGNKVSKGLQAAFKAIFEVHYEEHEAMLKKSRLGQLDDYPVTAPSPSRAATSRIPVQKPFHNMAFKENKPPKARHIVDAFGDPVSMTTDALDKLWANPTPSSKPSDDFHPQAAEILPSTRSGRQRTSSFASMPSDASANTKSAASKSFARQLEALKAKGVKVAGPAVHDRTHTGRSIATNGHYPVASHRLSDHHEDHARNVRRCQGPTCSKEGKSDDDWHRTADSFTRQMLAQRFANDEKNAELKAAQAEKVIAYAKTGKAGYFQAKKQEKEEKEEL